MSRVLNQQLCKQETQITTIKENSNYNIKLKGSRLEIGRELGNPSSTMVTRSGIGTGIICIQDSEGTTL